MTEATISNFIESQFPAFYKTDGENFIAFVRAYYEWMENEGGAIYESRKLRNYKDIDATTDDFILFFKEKYLKNIQFQLTSNKKLALKNSLDLYRAKGTERAVDLFFKLIYGIDPEIYYPGDDIFRLSSGKWVRPQYLEVSSSSLLVGYVGKQITGVNSKSTAFVEKYIKRKTKRGYVHLLYLSNIVGNFTGNEAITIDAQSPSTNFPRVIGSLSEIRIRQGGKDFKVGDIVDVISLSGVNAKARVTSIDNASGEVDFEFIEGGYGYTTSSEIFVANSTLTIANVNATTNNYFMLFEDLTQPLANLTFTNATATFTTNTSVSTANAEGKIIAVNQTGNTGTLLISVESGVFANVTTFHTPGNTVVAKSNTVSDVTATAKVLRKQPYVTIETTTSANPVVQVFDTAYQEVDGEVVASGTVLLAGDRTYTIENVTGAFRNSLVLKFRESTFSTPIRSITVTVDVSNTSGTFFADNGPLVRCGNAEGIVTNIVGGLDATFEVATVSGSEVVTINTDMLVDYLDVELSDTAYGLPGNPTGNLSSIIHSCLEYDNLTIGPITGITNENPGTDYEISPGVIIYQQYIAGTEKKDYIAAISNATSAFIVGETVQQLQYANTYSLVVGSTSGFTNGEAIHQGANIGQIMSITNSTVLVVANTTGHFTTSGNIVSYVTSTNTAVSNVSVANTEYSVKTKIKQANSTVLRLSRQNFNREYVPGMIKGLSSNTSANITHIAIDQNTLPMGLNAIVDAEVLQSNGIIKTVEVSDAGFGYVDEGVILVSDDDSRTATGVVTLGGQGKGTGYYKTQNGFLSANKKLFDGDYYQEYSYEIISRLPFDRYSEMLKKVMHVAGTKVFGSVLVDSTADVSLKSVVSEIVQFIAGIDYLTVDYELILFNGRPMGMQ